MAQHIVVTEYNPKWETEYLKRRTTIMLPVTWQFGIISDAMKGRLRNTAH